MANVQPMYAGGQPDSPKAMTLNERLDSALQEVEISCSHIQGFIERVQSEPTRAIGQAGANRATTVPLTGNVERAETLAKIMSDLVGRLERIA